MAKKSQNMVEVQEQRFNENTRTVYLIDDIDQEQVRNAIIALHCLDDTQGNIMLVLSTSGGCEDSAYALHDVIKHLRNDVIITGLGRVYSAGTIVFAAGDKRYLTTHTKFMMHYGDMTLHGTSVESPPGTGTEGKIDARTMIAIGKDMEECMKRYMMLMSAYSGQPPGSIRDWCDREVYFTAGQAVSYGFAHEVLKYESIPK